MLYPGNGKALFMQLKDIIMQWIDSGELKPNDKLPSERVLMGKYNISRVTVRYALNDLVQKNIIIKKHGKGYFVSPPQKIEYQLDSLLGFIEEFTIKKMKCKISSLKREFLIPPKEVRSAFGTQPNEKVFLLSRLIFVDREPLAIDKTYLPAQVAVLLENMNLTNSILYRIFEKNNYKLTFADQWISAEKPGADEAKLLGIKSGDPILVIYRKTHVEGNAVLLFSRTVYRADRYQYYITLKRYPQNHIEPQLPNE
ncbi:MAG: GntR family transcriptional regulator [Treponema sp.]|nr:GntR family transcriptional regulator [Treponema sp.]